MVGRKITSTLFAPLRLASSVATVLNGVESARRAEADLQSAIESRALHHQYVTKRLNDITSTTQVVVEPRAA